MKTVAELADLTVNEVTREYPRSITVFNRHGIDACCGGAATVREAAARDAVDVAALLAELQRLSVSTA